MTGVELVDGDEARARFPFLGPAVRQIRYRAGDGVLDPKEAALGLLEGAHAPVVARCRVTGFELTGGRLAAVQTERGTIAAGACVIAAGPMSGAVAALAGVELPLHVLRRHKVVLPDVPQVPAGRAAGLRRRHRRALAAGVPRRGRPGAGRGRRDARAGARADTRSGLPVRRARPGQRELGGPRDAVLGRGVARRTRRLVAPVRPVHDDARPPAAARRHPGRRALPQHGLQRPRRHAEHRRRPARARRHDGRRRRARSGPTGNSSRSRHARSDRSIGPEQAAADYWTASGRIAIIPTVQSLLAAFPSVWARPNPNDLEVRPYADHASGAGGDRSCPGAAGIGPRRHVQGVGRRACERRDARELRRRPVRRRRVLSRDPLDPEDPQG